MNKLLAVVVLVLTLASCNPKHEWLKHSIETQEKALAEKAKSGKVDSAAVVALLKDYETFAADYPTDTASALYLYKGADFYRYLHKPLRSIELYKKIYDTYPTFGRRPYALFLQGFIFENEIGNPHAARPIYEKFLAEYPNNPMAKDVRTSLLYLGKTPEQIMAEFQANAQRDSIAKANTTTNP
ncbi:MAG TPA: tetratricopeptide repeat protein [Chitinophagales bacterium]|nr:tetratricopeptide repeat protein [Chitinophagales bacterium]